MDRIPVSKKDTGMRSICALLSKLKVLRVVIKVQMSNLCTQLMLNPLSLFI